MSCPHCDDTGWRPVEIDGVRRVARCECWREALVDRLLADANIPPRYRKCTLEGFDTYNDSLVDAVRKSKRFVDEFPVVDRGILFLGGPGLGKTHLATAILQRILKDKGVRCLFYRTPDLLGFIRSTYDREVKATQAGVLQPVLTAELLVLDDLGEERPTDWVAETLNLVINTRYNHKLPTLLTSNYPVEAPPQAPSADTLIERVGFRIFSRLHEMCDFVSLIGVDYRELGANATREDLAALHQKGSRTHAPTARKKSMLRAQLNSEPPDVKWTGGKAGS